MEPRPAVERPDSQRGLGLVELILVLALLLVLAAVSVPNVQGVVESQKLQTATSMLAGKLAEGRMNALKRNRRVWLEIDAVGGSVQLHTGGAGGSSLVLGGPGLLPAGVGFPAAVPDVAFDSLGRAEGALERVVSVEVVRTGARRSVRVSAAGAVVRE